MIVVVNKRNHTTPLSRRTKSVDYYIGRPSPLGNPFRVGEYSREESLELYDKWLEEKINQGDRVILTALAHLAKLSQQGIIVNLVCWCKPLPCHGDIIKRILEEIIANEEEH